MTTLLSSVKSANSLKGKKVLLTVGATREYLDPVRFFSNASSGKLGLALAKAFYSSGARPFLICGPQIGLPPFLHGVSVVSAREMYAEAKKHFPDSDIFVSSAAVADYRPQKKKLKKIRKNQKELFLELVPNPDILRLLARKKKHQFCIGFALEDVNGLKNARRKMKEKNCDLMVLNSTKTMGSDFIRPTVLTNNGKILRFKRMSKTQFAKKLCKTIAKFL